MRIRLIVIQGDCSEPWISTATPDGVRVRDVPDGMSVEEAERIALASNAQQ